MDRENEGEWWVDEEEYMEEQRQDMANQFLREMHEQELHDSWADMDHHSQQPPPYISQSEQPRFVTLPRSQFNNLRNDLRLYEKIVHGERRFGCRMHEDANRCYRRLQRSRLNAAERKQWNTERIYLLRAALIEARSRSLANNSDNYVTSLQAAKNKSQNFADPIDNNVAGPSGLQRSQHENSHAASRRTAHFTVNDSDSDSD